MEKTPSHASAAEVIDALGGPAAAGRMLGVSPQAAWQWREAGIPGRHHLTLWKHFQALGIDLPDDAFKGSAERAA